MFSPMNYVAKLHPEGRRQANGLASAQRSDVICEQRRLSPLYLFRNFRLRADGMGGFLRSSIRVIWLAVNNGLVQWVGPIGLTR